MKGFSGYLKKTIFWFFLLVVCLTSSPLLGNNHLQFSQLTVEDGLPQNTVHAIVQDKYGFMWFGTWNGLVRFDGYEYKTYQYSEDDTTSLINNRVHLLYKDDGGDIWVSTFDSIICRYNYVTDDFTRFSPEEVPEKIRVSTNRFMSEHHLNASWGSLVWSIEDNNLWQRCNETGSEFNYHSGIFDSNSLSDDLVYCIYLDSNDVLWVGTANGGVNKSDMHAGRFVHRSLVMEEEGKIFKSPVRAIWVNEDSVWVGSNSHGVAVLSRDESLVNSIVTSRVDESLYIRNSRSIYGDAFGSIWLGYRMGLYRYDPVDNTLIDYTEHKIPRYPIYSIIGDEDEGLWVGGYNNLYLYNREKDLFEMHPLPFNDPGSSVMSLLVDQSSNLWAGTELHGLIKIERDTFTKEWENTIIYSKGSAQSHKLPDNRVYSLWEDSSANIWVGTGNGLCRIDAITGNVMVYNHRQGLADNYISKVLGDHLGYLWISHKKGLSRMNVDSDEIRNFSLMAGFSGYEFMDGSGFRDPETGQLFFGGIDGYVSFYPDEVFDNPFPPQVVFTNIAVSNELVIPGMDINGRIILERPLYLTSGVTLDFNNRRFSIEFSALHFSSPTENLYQYKLEGYDTDWIQTDAFYRRASYTGLAPGEYELKVIAANSDGVWSEEPSSVKIVVLPPWWLTTWAYMGYIIVLGMIGFLIYYVLSVKWHTKHQVQVERLKFEKLNEVQQLKTKFFTSVSHELRTPLTLIIDPLDRLINQEIKQEERKKYYSLIRKNAGRLLALVNQLLDFKRIESGHEKLELSPVDIDSYFRALFSTFEIMATQRKIRYRYDSGVKDLKGLLDKDKVDKILYNLISNAFKFTPSGGEIVLSLEMIPISGSEGENKGVWLQISVADSGAGIKKENLSRIFDFFYKSGDANIQESTGIGLSITKELVRLHGGDISVDSTPGEGSRFTLLLPFIVCEEDGSDNAEILFEKDENVERKNYAEIKNKEYKVLIVEDNDELRDYMCGLLESEYEIAQASNGVIGYKMIQKEQPDLIISDIVMPEMSGLELCHKVKEDMRTFHIPVILLTSLQDSEIEGVENGADVYLKKPFNSPLLFRHIENLIKLRIKIRNRFGNKELIESARNVKNQLDSEFLDRFVHATKNNLAIGNFDVRSLAQELGISRTQLYRKVKSITSLSVFDYVNAIRMEMAIELLNSNRYTIAEISDRIGFSEPGNFSRAFTKYYGKSPKEFRINC